MIVFRCKMCGGRLEFGQGDTIAVCDSCGIRQTLPKLDDDRRINLYDRADHFRRNGEFDKAMRIYEQILGEDNDDAEAYWSLVLCRYGIEYVEDLGTHRRVPTVNRLQYTSIFDDADYESAMRYADDAQREVYREEAAAINAIQKEILAISQVEQPYDVFICYKESGADGKRTPDSVLANDLYYELTEEGFRVFFARITLEDKLGTAYEPYIFAALGSAKVMVVVGTKPEHFNAAWVRNEWSRYLTLIREGAKKTLIPAYRDMDPYDLPEEFSHLQAQDMSKLGFMQDLVRGIRKMLADDAPKAAVKEAGENRGDGGVGTESLLKRVSLFLEDGDWADADEYCERVLDRDPECGQAYLGKLMAELQVHRQEELADCGEPFDTNKNYNKILRFGNEKLKAILARYNADIVNRNEAARMEAAYASAVEMMRNAKDVGDYRTAAAAFDGLGLYRDAPKWKEECLEKADWHSKAEIYREAMGALRAAQEAGNLIGDYEAVLKKLRMISGWGDADEQIRVCEQRIEEIQAEQERWRMEQERRAEESRNAAREHREKRRRKARIAAIVIAAALVLCFGGTMAYTAIVVPASEYKGAIHLYDDGRYREAAEAFRELGDYWKSREWLEACYRQMYGDELYAQLCEINPGDIYKFGNYHGSTEWIVLETDGSRLLLISRYCLDSVNYHNGRTADWQSCTLRRWLNQTFYQEAFDEAEQAKILDTALVNPKNETYNTGGGTDTVDKVFLLCIDEAKQYFADDRERRAACTAYAKEQGGESDGEDYAGWWLRSPGSSRGNAAYVDAGGEISLAGDDIRNHAVGVRPVIWIDLAK